jgi:hypothetical protein
MSSSNETSANSSLISTVSDLAAEITPLENSSLLSTLSDVTGEISPVENSSLLSTLSDVTAEVNPATNSFLETLSQIYSQNEPTENSSLEPSQNPSEEIPIVQPNPDDLNRLSIDPSLKESETKKPINEINQINKKNEEKRISAPQNNDFFNQMESMFDDITIDLLFIHNQKSESFEELTQTYVNKNKNIPNETKNVTNKEKLRQIFDYFRSASVLYGGSLSLIDFKFLIKNKISAIRPKISQ